MYAGVIFQRDWRSPLKVNNGGYSCSIGTSELRLATSRNCIFTLFADLNCVFTLSGNNDARATAEKLPIVVNGLCFSFKFLLFYLLPFGVLLFKKLLSTSVMLAQGHSPLSTRPSFLGTIQGSYNCPGISVSNSSLMASGDYASQVNEIADWDGADVRHDLGPAVSTVPIVSMAPSASESRLVDVNVASVKTAGNDEWNCENGALVGKYAACFSFSFLISSLFSFLLFILFCFLLSSEFLPENFQNSQYSSFTNF